MGTGVIEWESFTFKGQGIVPTNHYFMLGQSFMVAHYFLKINQSHLMTPVSTDGIRNEFTKKKPLRFTKYFPKRRL